MCGDREIKAKMYIYNKTKLRTVLIIPALRAKKNSIVIERLHL